MIVQRGLKIGIHGIERGSVSGIMSERKRFSNAYGYECNGIRMHYLARDHSMVQAICDAGYAFDSSHRGEGPSMRIGNSIHFPLHVMDSDVLIIQKRYQNVHAVAAISATKERISRLIDAKVDYISILFHDRYFSDAHASWRDWYQGVVGWIKVQNIPMTNYDAAVATINRIDT